MTVIAPERAKLGYGLGTDEGEAFWLLGMLETIKIGGEDTGGQYGLVEIEVRAGEGSPWHVHPDEDEWFYVLDGEFTFHVGDAELTLPAGGLPSAPRACRTRSSQAPTEARRWSASSRFCSKDSCERSVSRPSNAFFHRRSTLRRTWRGSSRSVRSTGWRSSGPLDRRRRAGSEARPPERGSAL